METDDTFDLTKYVADDIAKYSGVSMPVKAGLLQRLLIKNSHVKNSI